MTNLFAHVMSRLWFYPTGGAATHPDLDQLMASVGAMTVHESLKPIAQFSPHRLSPIPNFTTDRELFDIVHPLYVGGWMDEAEFRYIMRITTPRFVELVKMRHPVVDQSYFDPDEWADLMWECAYCVHRSTGLSDSARGEVLDRVTFDLLHVPDNWAAILIEAFDTIEVDFDFIMTHLEGYITFPGEFVDRVVVKKMNRKLNGG